MVDHSQEPKFTVGMLKAAVLTHMKMRRAESGVAGVGEDADELDKAAQRSEYDAILGRALSDPKIATALIEDHKVHQAKFFGR